jgi:hypothetical protein
MKYKHHQLEYEINDEWLHEAGAYDFNPIREHYCTSSDSINGRVVLIVPIDSIEPLTERAHLRGIFCDDHKTGESARQRVVRILRWFLCEHEVEPVKVVHSLNKEYKYKLVEGCHRFYCANAIGFKSVPATLGFDINDPNA